MNGRIGSLFFLLLTAFSYGDPVVHIDGDLPAVGFVSKGGVKSTDGPVSPEYPGFPMENKGIYLDGSGRLMMDDPGYGTGLQWVTHSHASQHLVELVTLPCCVSRPLRTEPGAQTVAAAAATTLLGGAGVAATATPRQM